MNLAMGKRKKRMGNTSQDVELRTKIRPLLITLPKMNRYFKRFKKTKTQCMSFEIKDEKLLEKHESIRSKIKNLIVKKIDEQPVYGEEYLRSR